MNIPSHIKEVALSLYSIDYLLKCRVCGIEGKKLTLAPVSGKVDMFQFNDPVAIVYMDNNQLYLRGGDVKTIDGARMEVTLSVISNETEEERRIFDRYPSSILVDARKKRSSKRLNFIAKNISLYGMGAVSKAELDVDEQVDIDLITGKYMFYFGGKVVWKKQLENCFEYGFTLTDFDIATKRSFEVYLGKLKSEFLNAYGKAR